MAANACTCKLVYDRRCGFHVLMGPLCAACRAKIAAQESSKASEAQTKTEAQKSRSAAIKAILDDIFVTDIDTRVNFILYGLRDISADDLDSIRAQAIAYRDTNR